MQSLFSLCLVVGEFGNRMWWTYEQTCNAAYLDGHRKITQVTVMVHRFGHRYV